MTGFTWVRLRGGPLDGRRERLKHPLPHRLLMPVWGGRERTWGTDETVLTGVERYALQLDRRNRPFYAIVKREDDERGDQG